MALKFLNDGYFAGKVGIGIQTPTSKLHINQNVTNPDLDTPSSFAVEIDSNHSGSDATTGDREQGGLYIDVDSSTTGGDTSNEHRLYGIWNVVNHSGDCDQAYGTYSTVEQNTTAGTTTNLIAVNATAISDGGALASVSNITGSYGATSLQDTTPIGNSWAGRFMNNSISNRTGATAEAYGIASEIQIDSTSSFTNLYAGRFSIDSNAAYTATSSYLLYLDYQGTSLATNVYSIYSPSDVKSYHEGSFGIGTDSPSAKLMIETGPDEGIRIYRAATNANFGAIEFRNSDDTATNSRIGFNSNEMRLEATNQFRFVTNSSDRMYIDSSGNVGIGDSTPESRLKVKSDTSNTSSNTVSIEHIRDDPDVATNAVKINMDLSGVDNTTADRTNSGLFIDVDSSANGDAANEHRIYGVYSDVRFDGFSDLARGGYFLAESNYNGAKTAQLIGVLGSAIHETSSTNGGVSNMYGVYGTSSVKDKGDVDIAYGVFAKTEITSARTEDVGITKGVEGQVEINAPTALNYGTMIAVSSVIDNNETTVPNFGTQYLFKGDYQGTKGDNTYGIYTEGDKNYFSGNVGIGVSSPGVKLHVESASLGENINDATTQAIFEANTASSDKLYIQNYRTVAGTAWTSNGKRIQERIDSTWMGYIQFNGGETVSSGNGDISFGTGQSTTQSSVTEKMRIKSNAECHLELTGTAPVIKVTASNGSSGLRINTAGQSTGSLFRVQKDGATEFDIDINGGVRIKDALLSNQENTDIDTGAEVVAQVSTSLYTAAFFDFVIKKGTNVRSGTVYACHDGTNVEFTETSTQDLGDTSDVVLSVNKSGTNLRLLATVASNDWSVKSLIRAI